MPGRFKFSDNPEVEELQVLFMLVDWFQAKSKSKWQKLAFLSVDN